MSFLKRLFGAPKLDGEQMALAPQVADFGPIELLAAFSEPRVRHTPGEQQRWTRALPQSYGETLALFQKQGWLEESGMGLLSVTARAEPFVATYRARLAREKVEAIAAVRGALAEKDTSRALDLRRQYEGRYPLGEVDWTGLEPQLSHSALTRRIFFLEHWLLDGFAPATAEWLKLYAAEQHLWGAFWQLDETEIPEAVRADFADSPLPRAEAVYWKAFQLGLLVDNQETWQRCKGGDHVRRLVIVGPDDEHTCEVCREILGKEYLVARVPELPLRACTSARGCRCRYEPVLESYEE
ncbi:MAG: hypothetical protein WDZ49_07985 [Litorilinea sp.]